MRAEIALLLEEVTEIPRILEAQITLYVGNLVVRLAELLAKRRLAMVTGDSAELGDAGRSTTRLAQVAATVKSRDPEDLEIPWKYMAFLVNFTLV